MAYISADARQQLGDAIGDVAEGLGRALAMLGAAYEQLDEGTADRLESELFGPVQKAYGRAKRTHDGFAARHGLTGRAFDAAEALGGHATSRELIDRAVGTVEVAESTLGSLQDSMMPVEVGDAELRTGLTEVRTLVTGLRSRARELERTLGR